MKICVLGSRSITNYKLVERVIRDSGFEITELVSGKCPKGVDHLGEIWATKHNIPIKYFPADWDKFGRSAGMLRNSQLIEYSDAVIIIHDGVSKGTKDSWTKAKKKGIPIYYINTSIKHPLFN